MDLDFTSGDELNELI